VLSSASLHSEWMITCDHDSSHLLLACVPNTALNSNQFPSYITQMIRLEEVQATICGKHFRARRFTNVQLGLERVEFLLRNLALCCKHDV
jgi:hypothetical protein